jgi:hypothetical protein
MKNLTDDERLMKGVATLRELVKDDTAAAIFTKDQNTVLYMLAVISVAIDTTYERHQNALLSHSIHIVENHLSDGMKASLLKSIEVVKKQFGIVDPVEGAVH